jgi:hypothetical protein
MASLALARPEPVFKGSSQRLGGQHVFRKRVAGKHIQLGQVNTEAAEPCARLYDALQLLLHGPRADTNFEWSSYTQADIAAAISFLQAKGVDAHQAVAAARETKGSDWIGVTQNTGRSAWRAGILCQMGKSTGCTTLYWNGLPSAEAAAHQADCGFLAVRGLGCTPNFPASTYSQQQLQEAGEYSVSKGLDKGSVDRNLAAVQQVRGHDCFQIR